MRLSPIVVVAALAIPVVAATADLATVLAGPQRSAASKARDAYRHPAETLAFFGAKPTMTVVEISPQGGWYTEILAPYLRDRGHYIAAAADPKAKGGAASVATFRAKLAADPGSFQKVAVTAFGKGAYDIAPPGSADMVLTFRNVHNFDREGFGPQAFTAFYTVLKRGGILGVEEHRLPEDGRAADESTTGYMKVSTVKRLAVAAGFRFVGESAINANPKDDHDHPGGVWNLPPTYADGDKDRAKYSAIGESDRMTLKFVKPS